MTDLRSVDEAIAAILERIVTKSAEEVPLPQALDRVLADDIISDVDLPPFANSAMDGYAVRAADVPATLPVRMDIPAGANPQQALPAGTAARIMTGAPLPEGADAVVPVEETDDDFSKLADAHLPETVTIHAELQTGANIRPAGENIANGATILTRGRTLSPADIGMLAAIGRATVPVIRKPRVAIISSGDELVDVQQPLQPGKIRDVNSYTLEALITQNGGEAVRLPIAPDTPDALRELFQTALAEQPDLIISSAGVSVGAADYVREIVEELGNLAFWKINLRPGKPLAFGDIGGVPFFGLPGNPVSAIVTFEVLVRPALLKLGGRTDDSRTITAITGETMRSDGRRTYARVTLHEDENGRIIAHETGTQSSGVLMSLVMADGLLIIPEGTTEVEQGTTLRVKLL